LRDQRVAEPRLPALCQHRSPQRSSSFPITESDFNQRNFGQAFRNARGKFWVA